MCGIVGIINLKQSICSDKIKAMLKKIKHRGPSVSQTWHSENIALGCARLSMCDTKSKKAVFNSKDGRLTLVYNGEISNYIDLRQKLTESGHRFLTNNDAEVIIHLYEEYGSDFISYLDGMFAFCLVDYRKKMPKVIIGRDHFGIKPLYIYKHNDEIVFSSEIRPILCYAPKQKLNMKAVASFLNYRFAANPLTPFEDIEKLEPSHILIIGKTIRKKAYEPKCKSVTGSFYDIFRKSVKQNLQSEVPLGFFVSGGIDSGIVTALAMQMNYKGLGFTVKYGSSSLNEDGYAAEISKRYDNLEGKYVDVRSDMNLAKIIDKVVQSLEEPIYSTVSVSTYLLAQEACKYVSGVLSGDGADELFMSYKYLSSAYHASNPIKAYKQKIGWLAPELKKLLFYDRNIFKRINLISGKKKVTDAYRDFELKYRLPDYHLLRLDKLTMANSLEARVPFLSSAVLYYSNKLDFHEILNDKTEKRLFKENFRHILPSVICNRVKQPFSAPYEEWIDTALKSDIQKVFQDKECCRRFSIKQEKLKDLAAKNKKSYFEYTAVWGLYILFKWYKIYRKYVIDD